MTRTRSFKAAATVVAALLAACIFLIYNTRTAEAAFSGRNGRIVFQRDGDLWLTGPNGFSAASNRLLAELTPNTPTSQEVDPAMSPDGRKVAFASNRDGDFEIFTLGIYTGTLTKVTRNTVRDAQPAWAPNGLKIAYESPNTLMGGDEDIFVSNADGTGFPVDRVNVSGNQRTPSWSPDGNEIAYYDEPVGDIAVQTLSSGTFRDITSNRLASQDMLPNWSPDGDRIVFQSNRPAPDGTTDYEIYTARSSDGGDLRQLTDNTFDDGDAVYSPSGAKIVHADYFTGDGAILTRDSSDGSNELQIMGGPTDDVAPDWGDVVPAPAGCTVGGTAFPDSITGTNAGETICAMVGNDRVSALGGNDVLKGAKGRDILFGGLGRDTLLGSDGSDTLDSRDNVNGNDSLDGGRGRDRCLKDIREASVRNCP